MMKKISLTVGTDCLIYKLFLWCIEGRILALGQKSYSCMATHVGILPGLLAGRSTGPPKLNVSFG